MPAERTAHAPRTKRELVSKPKRKPDSSEGVDSQMKPKATRKRKANPPTPAGQFGPIEGYPVLTKFKNREDCMKSAVHGVSVAGIHGSKTFGAYSICMSGGYEDDMDDGDFIIYTGAGGQENSYQARSSQVNDQSFDHDHNAALKLNSENGQPVRVVRGENKDSRYAPLEGLRYDGLYKVEKAFLDQGLSGRKICSFQLRRLPGQPPIPTKWK